MRAVLGVVSLLVVMALVGLLARKQLQATQQVVPASGMPAAQVGTATPANVRDQSQQLQRQVADDVAKALAQGAARASEAGQ